MIPLRCVADVRTFFFLAASIVMDAAGAADAGAGVHQLERAWCLWETRVLPGKSRFDYLDKNKKAFTFSSVEEFWQYWNNYPKPSCVACRCCSRAACAACGERAAHAAGCVRRGVRNSAGLRASLPRTAGGPRSKIMSNGRDKKMIVYEDGNHELEALCMFVEGVKPAWEDPANESGAELRVSIRARHAPGCVRPATPCSLLAGVPCAAQPAPRPTWTKSGTPWS